MSELSISKTDPSDSYASITHIIMCKHQVLSNSLKSTILLTKPIAVTPDS